jgi:hypothetical protein
MTQRNPIALARATNTARPTDLLQLCRQDYLDAAPRREQDHRDDAHLVPYTEPTPAVRDQREPSDLTIAIRVGQRMLAIYGTVDTRDIYAYAQAHGGLTEALRILLRALGAGTEAS